MSTTRPRIRKAVISFIVANVLAMALFAIWLGWLLEARFDVSATHGWSLPIIMLALAGLLGLTNSAAYMLGLRLAPIVPLRDSCQLGCLPIRSAFYTFIFGSLLFLWLGAIFTTISPVATVLVLALVLAFFAFSFGWFSFHSLATCQPQAIPFTSRILHAMSRFLISGVLMIPICIGITNAPWYKPVTEGYTYARYLHVWMVVPADSQRHGLDLTISGTSPFKWDRDAPPNHFDLLQLEGVASGTQVYAHINTRSKVVITDRRTLPVTVKSLAQALWNQTPENLSPGDLQAIDFIETIISEAQSGSLPMETYPPYEVSEPAPAYIYNFQIIDTYRVHWPVILLIIAWVGLCLWSGFRKRSHREKFSNTFTDSWSVPPGF